MKNGHFERKEIQKSIRFFYIWYVVMGLFLFGSVLYDSFLHSLPFYYVLFFLFGRILGLVYSRTQSMEWDDDKNLVITKHDKIGIFILMIFILFRYFFLEILVERSIHPLFLTDAITLVTLGVFYTRLRMYGRQIKLLAWTNISSRLKKEDN